MPVCLTPSSLKKLSLVALLSLSLPLAARAQTESDLDPDVQAISDKMVEAYKALSAFQERVSLRTESSTGGAAVIGDGTVVIRVQRPNKLFFNTDVTAKGKTQSATLVCDGAAVWRYNSMQKTYTKAKAPADLSGIAGVTSYASELAALIAGKSPFEGQLAGKTRLEVGTPDKVNGVDVDTVEGVIATNEGMTGQVRFLVGRDDHLIRGASISLNRSDPSMGKPFSQTITLTYEMIDTNPTFTDSDFTFTPPPGAKLAAPGAKAPAKAKPSKTKRAKHK